MGAEALHDLLAKLDLDENLMNLRHKLLMKHLNKEKQKL